MLRADALEVLGLESTSREIVPELRFDGDIQGHDGSTYGLINYVKHH